LENFDFVDFKELYKDGKDDETHLVGVYEAMTLMHIMEAILYNQGSHHDLSSLLHP